MTSSTFISYVFRRDECMLLTSPSTPAIDVITGSFAMFFHPSHIPVAYFPVIWALVLISTLSATLSRTLPERTRRSGTTASGLYFAKNLRVCGLLTKFQGVWVATKSLHKSILHSSCCSAVHVSSKTVSKLDPESVKTVLDLLRLNEDLFGLGVPIFSLPRSRSAMIWSRR